VAYLELKGLVKDFGGVRAIDDVSISIEEGTFASFLGPSGCGKTTTLRCVAGLETATSGTISFRGRDVTSLPVERRNIGMVFQNYALFPHMTVAENVAFGMRMRGRATSEIDRRVDHILQLVQLPDHRRRYPRELSGGQQQRVALARALVFEPDILLLDEPLANLDAKLRVEMRSFIRSLQKEVGITTIYVTHDQAEAMTMSDVVVVMFDGKVHQVDKPTAIYADPRSALVAQFIGAANVVPGRLVDGAFEAGFGRIVARGGTQRNDPVQAVIRPEDIVLSAEPSSSSFPVRIVDAEFLGNLVHYTVETDTGVTLAVQALGEQRYDIGRTVHVGVEGRGVWILP